MRNKSSWMFLLLCLSCLNGQIFAEEVISTNPCRPWVDKFQLPDYDTALDRIDYSVADLGLRWPWYEDSERMEKHKNAVNTLSAIYPFWLEGRISDSYTTKELKHLSFIAEVDTAALPPDDIVLPVKLTDDVLAKTLPYIPEVRSISLQQTSVTDKGLKNFYYLPCLQSVTLSRQDKITEEGLRLICQHPSVKKFAYNDTEITLPMLKTLEKNGSKLSYLQFSEVSFPPVNLSFIEKMKQIEVLIIMLSRNESNEIIKTVSKDFFSYLVHLKQLNSICLSRMDFSEAPSQKYLQNIETLKRNKKLLSLNISSCSLHPLLLKKICKIQSIQSLDLFEKGSLIFTPEKPICYERVMYELYKKNAVPEYYQKLEKEFEEELKWHVWVDKKGKELKAKLVKIEKKKVSLEKEDGTVITISRSRLNEDNQLYLKELERLEEDKKNDAEKAKREGKSRE